MQALFVDYFMLYFAYVRIMDTRDFVHMETSFGLQGQWFRIKVPVDGL